MSVKVETESQILANELRVTDGNGFVVTVIGNDSDSHPLLLVTVTKYVPDEFTIIVCVDLLTP